MSYSIEDSSLVLNFHRSQLVFAQDKDGSVCLEWKRALDSMKEKAALEDSSTNIILQPALPLSRISSGSSSARSNISGEQQPVTALPLARVSGSKGSKDPDSMILQPAAPLSRVSGGLEASPALSRFSGSPNSPTIGTRNSAQLRAKRDLTRMGSQKVSSARLEKESKSLRSSLGSSRNRSTGELAIGDGEEGKKSSSFPCFIYGFDKHATF